MKKLTISALLLLVMILSIQLDVTVPGYEILELPYEN
jgi:hypothetical protein